MLAAVDLSLPDHGPRHRVKFLGEGGTLFGIFIVNALLTALTLGVYYFWGRVKTRRYVYGQTELGGDRFAFHGTGKELLIGWLKVMGCTIVVVGVFGFFARFLGSLAIVAMLLLYGGLLFLIPYAMVGATRYQLSRSSYRGIRFSFRGSAEELVGPFVKGALLTALSLGFYSPYFQTMIQSFFINNTCYGSRRFSYDGRGEDLFRPFVKAFFLSIVTLGIYGIWYQAERARYNAAHTRFGDLRFESTVTGGALFGLVITNVLLVVCTAGIAAPWAVVRLLRFHCDNLILRGSLDLSDVTQDKRGASAIGEELADALDIGAGVGLGM